MKLRIEPGLRQDPRTDRRSAAALPAAALRAAARRQDAADRPVGSRNGGSRRATLWVLCCVAALVAGGRDVSAEIGTTTGLPVPRFMSLRSDNVPLHVRPKTNLPISWVFQRAGLPVEVTAEFELWRKIRDADGAEGWVLHTQLSGRRTALVAPWKKDFTVPLYGQANEHSEIVANLQPYVLGNILGCSGTWCRIFGEGFDGWELQTNLWGVYPGERVQ